MSKYYSEFRRPEPSDILALQGIDGFSEFVTDVRVCYDSAILVEVTQTDDTFITGSTVFTLANRFAVPFENIAIDPGYTKGVLELVIYRANIVGETIEEREPNTSELDAIETEETWANRRRPSRDGHRAELKCLKWFM